MIKTNVFYSNFKTQNSALTFKEVECISSKACRNIWTFILDRLKSFGMRINFIYIYIMFLNLVLNSIPKISYGSETYFTYTY